MYYNFVSFLSKTLVGGGGEAGAAAAAEPGVAATAAGAAPAGLFGGSMGMVTILIYVGLFAALWFFMIRPQKKREKAAREMQQSLGVGDNVVTSSGLFGVISSIGDDCFVIEFGTNKGVRIPVRKGDIVGTRTPKLTQTNKDASAE